MRSAAAMACAFALLCAAGSAGCERRDDLDGRRRPIPGLEPTSEGGDTSGGRRREVAFDAIDNRATALVFASRSLVIPGRGAGLATFTAGGAPAGWFLGSGAHPAARTDGQVAELWFPYDQDPGGIGVAGGSVGLRLRFRAAAKSQLVSVFLNDAKVGDVPMDSEATSTYAIDLPASGLRPGPNHLRLFFRYAVAEEGVRTAGSLEQLAIGSGDRVTGPAVVAAPVEHGGKRHQALSMKRPGRYSFFVQVPAARPSLELSVAGKGRAEVRLAAGAAGSRRLWGAPAGDSWTDASIDLSEVAGELVRIDLIGDGPLDWARPQVVADPVDRATASGPAADHVVLWVVSGLRASALDAAPALRELAKRGISRVALSQTPQPGLAARELFTGVAGRDASIPAEADTLAEKFRRAGYSTTLISSAPPVPGDAQGFERTYRMRSSRPTELWAKADEVLAERANRRTLTVIWADDPALPWTPPPERLDASWKSYTGRVQPTATLRLAQSLRAGSPALAPRDRDYVRALYAGEVAAVDAGIAAMVAGLEKLDIADRTAVIVAGDRGQELFERGGFGDPVSLHRESLEVPLVVLAPGRPASEEAAGYHLVADVYATALDLAQIPLPAATRGVSALSGPPPTRAAHLYLKGRERGLEWSHYKWLAPVRGDAALFDLEADPGEKKGAPSANPVAARALSGWLGLLVAFDGHWAHRRWGSVASLRPAFATEHGGP